METCKCLLVPVPFSDFDRRRVGIDETKGRFGEVSIETCRLCGSKWLRYFVEYEGFSESGRWYRGQVSDAVAREVTPATAVAVLEGLKEYFYGGSYFRSGGNARVGAGAGGSVVEEESGPEGPA